MNGLQQYLSERNIRLDGADILNDFDTYEKISLMCTSRLQRAGIDEQQSVVIFHLAQNYLETRFGVKYKILNDSVHGTIRMHPVAVKIIDSPQFQRLRNLKQLGTVEYVYPGANHSRFEHCIGTYHIAGQVIDHLMTNQPGLKIEEKDKLCVQLAALCHDLGHGPYSHLFDHALYQKNSTKKCCHEERSARLVQQIYENDETFKTWGLDQKDVDFIKVLIIPQKEQIDSSRKPKFLFDIVSNKNSGLDVDKFDYIARDSLHLGIRSRFEYTRLLPFMRVIGDSICIRDKEINVIDDLFSTRYDLHSKAYQHPISVGIELMLAEAFAKIDNLDEYANETDESICIKILALKGFDGPKELIRSVRERKLWKFVGLVRLTEQDAQDDLSSEDVQSDMAANLPYSNMSDKLKVTVRKIHFGSNRRNPFEKIKFYTRDCPNEAFLKTAPELKRDILHDRFFDQVVFVFSKVRDENTCLSIFNAFGKWCQKKKYPSPYRT